ncbi:hemolysin family protein [Schaalia hyovaginalis]|uniref:hemolysin family protein n=1 Tax=Schaalia hyovaginalis TaxID=29316 RepID=UPI001F1F389F|nr:hemolysin family protein [Schaalia hyovaginalis]MCF2710642.1 HlyC/CorC family transporter [Schaalia hyovaginalis]MCI6556476.1 hemolysin family protein [Schaalia hyovaginalis]MDD7553922.1 hemolysin family protein [Schaalia hyovaginalis]MDY3094695.1 hemolysin family protein [Schaalia hyovaginalis]MDY4493057.1 hemolysin family protein [Schaalia hyovaginalis]
MSIGWGLTITLVLLALNAFFVAGEFATTSSRRSQIEPLRAEGARGSAHAMYALEHVSLMLAICQLGVTVASTTLGVVAEPAIAHLFEGPLERLGVPTATSHVFGFVIALVIVLFLHVVFGEMVPKNISLADPARLLLLLAPPLVAIGHLVGPIIRAMDHVANAILRWRGVEPKAEIAATFTAEEVASIVELSAAEGTLSDDLGLLSGSLEFSEETAASAMVPLSELVVLPSSITPAKVEREVAVTGFSRFPVADEQGGIQGYLHLKDVLYADADERDRPVTPWRIRKMGAVRAADEVEDALRHMQATGAHLALVTDDAGEVIGVLFLEDVLEELVGEVRDSLQREESAWERDAEAGPFSDGARL